MATAPVQCDLPGGIDTQLEDREPHQAGAGVPDRSTDPMTPLFICVAAPFEYAADIALA